MTEMTQVAPWPAELAAAVAECSYRAHEGWKVELVDDYPRDQNSAGATVGRGLTLIITTKGFDSYHPESGPTYRVGHFFIVPAATYNRASWERWLFEQFAKVELHAGERPFAPLHGPGEDPYTVHQHATQEQVDRRYFDHTGRD